jgi:hypothetical protein
MVATPITLTGRTRDATILGRAAHWVRANGPGFGRWLARFGARARTVVLTVAGLACVTAAAWAVALPLGLLTAGVSLLAVEYLSAPEGERRR